MGLGWYRFLRGVAVAVGMCSVGVLGACAETVCESAFGCGRAPAVDAGTCTGNGTSCRDASVNSEGIADATLDVPSVQESGSLPPSTSSINEMVDASLDAASDEVSESAPELDADATDSGATPTHCMPVEGGCQSGIFVSPKGDDAHDGTDPALPMHTIQSAMLRAKVARLAVFACDNGRGFVETLAVDGSLDGIEVHGGYDCTTWTFQEGGRTSVWSPTTTAVKVTGLVAGVLFERFELRATNAPPGKSSVAVMVNGSKNVLFRNVRIVAGDGGEGAPGTDGAKGQDGPLTGPAQLGTWAACPALFPKQAGGGWTSASLCGSRGGTGGDAILSGAGTKGQAGTPQDNVVRPGVDNGGSVDGFKLGGNGSDGLPGLPGKPSPSAGSFGPSGYTPGSSGGDGTDGYPGQGGGGGGASDATGTSCIGASGGAGGVGGCGGLHGAGAASGGASIALLSWASEISLDRCDLSAATGGRGGQGGNSGPGGVGGDGAGPSSGVWRLDSGDPVIEPGGQGGQGGNGGPGGPGAGGNGGPAYAVVFFGIQPKALNGTTLASGVGGLGGMGGAASPNLQGANGLSGSAAPQLAIP